MSRTWKRLVGNFALLLATLLLLLALDRLLLVRFPLPRWQPDPVLHYKHRPGNVYSWGEKYENKPLYINRHGFHDDEFPEARQENELRGLLIGDSVVMGHGVTREEAFANRLERLLEHGVPGYDAYQVINTGVQGYATGQYLEVLKRSLPFSPDFVVIGFCMNDVTEPYRVDKAFGGTGLDYHNVLQISHPWLSYLVNETGFGRLAIAINRKIHKRWGLADELARAEVYRVRRMAEHARSDSVFVAAWKMVLADMDAIYELAEARGLPVVLVIVPHTFQLGEAVYQAPQQILAEHALAHDVPYLDLTPVFEALLDAGVPLDTLYLDSSHFTAGGHRVVADTLLGLLQSKGALPEAGLR